MWRLCYHLNIWPFVHLVSYLLLVPRERPAFCCWARSVRKWKVSTEVLPLKVERSSAVTLVEQYSIGVLLRIIGGWEPAIPRQICLICPVCLCHIWLSIASEDYILLGLPLFQVVCFKLWGCDIWNRLNLPIFLLMKILNWVLSNRLVNSLVVFPVGCLLELTRRTKSI